MPATRPFISPTAKIATSITLPRGANGTASGILNALDESIGPIPRVLLRDSEADDFRLVRPASGAIPELAGNPGRYLLSGEIARGGMGVVFEDTTWTSGMNSPSR